MAYWDHDDLKSKDRDLDEQTRGVKREGFVVVISFDGDNRGVFLVEDAQEAVVVAEDWRRRLGELVDINFYRLGTEVRIEQSISVIPVNVTRG